ncbi:MAG TPA: hypothetical protein VHX65_03615 [Pirellulales bacterium]|jgi:hypothetical protein|nr:hypothetical protein [Pirellulales bacterium]
MTQIILDDAQAQIVLNAREPIQVCDPDGNVLGIIPPAAKAPPSGYVFTDAEIEAAKRSRANPGQCRTTQEVLEHLRAIWPENA